MRLLLDTHVLLWWLNEPTRLGTDARIAISDEANEVFVSAVNVWEVSIKSQLGKLDQPVDLLGAIKYYEFKELPVSLNHALAVRDLPLLHRDPFDRLLIVQAVTEDCLLVTSDDKILKYEVPHLDARPS